MTIFKAICQIMLHFFICNRNVHLLIVFNPGYHGNNHYMEKVAWKAQVIKLSCYQKTLAVSKKEVFLHIRLLYSFCVLFICIVIK